MASFADLSALINRATGGNSGSPEPVNAYKDARVAGAAAASPVATRWTSFWRYEGIPAHGAVPPTTAAAPDNTTDGGLKQTDPGGGRQKWQTYAAACCSQAGMLMIYDRLLHISGLSGTVITPQTVGGTLSRYTGAAARGNEIWVEVYSQVGATGTTISASYTDQDGNAGATTPLTTFGGTGFREAERIIRLPFATGDSGARAVASVTVTATTGTAGDFGITIARPLMQIPIPLAGIGSTISLLDGPVEWLTDACLALAFLPSSTAAVQTSLFAFACEA